MKPVLSRFAQGLKTPSGSMKASSLTTSHRKMAGTHLFIRDGNGEHWPIALDAVDRLHQLADERWRAKGEDLDRRFTLAQLEAMANSPRPGSPKLYVPLARRGQHAIGKGNVDLLPAIDWQGRDEFVAIRNPDPAKLGTRARLMPGQKVFFRIGLSGEGDPTHASEVSWSAIHRRTQITQTPIGKGPLTLGRQIALQNPDLLPLGVRPSRNLQPAEWMLGAVESGTRDEQSALAFASKIAVGMARAEGHVSTLEAIALKELSSPKPPSPALYLKRKNGGTAPFGKHEYVDSPKDYAFQGTKVYLHALRTNGAGRQEAVRLNQVGGPDATRGLPPWQSGKGPTLSDRQVTVSPVDAGQTFTFSIRFTNLSPGELELLCAAIAPSASFEHKIGMGRPIGLGSVKLAIQAIELVDFAHRYLEGVGGTAGVVDPVAYAARGMAKLRERHRELHDALLQVGEPGRIQAPVHYPQTAGADIEDRNYQWFVENDRAGQHRQMLIPLPIRAGTPPPPKQARRS